MSKVTDISDKLLEKTQAVQEALKLEEEIQKYLPVEIISSTLISYCCVQHIYYKSLKSDWRDNIECYLGLPNHVQKVKDIDSYEYGVFPLSLVHKIALYSMNLFQFSLSFVDIDEDEERYNINYANAVQKRRRAVQKVRERLFSKNLETTDG